MARNDDDYKPLAFYNKHTKAKTSGFSKFDVDGAYYFCRHVDGKIALISQSYAGEAGRDNGIDSVRKNSKIAKHVLVETRRGGKHGVSVIAGNRQEVAISPDLTSEAKAKHLRGRLLGTVKAAAKRAAPKKPKRAANDEQNYKPLAFYKKHTKGKQKGYESFEKDGQHYFAYFENGKIALISEGYPTLAAHDVGLASVKKNLKNPDRYKYRGPLKKSKKYDFSLRAGNHKEIARSPWYGSAAAAATGAAYLMGKRKRTAPKPKAKPKAAPVIAAAAATAAAAPAMAKAVTPPPPPPPPPPPKPKAVAAPPPAAVAAGPGIWGWLKWLLLGLAALLAMFFLFKSCKPAAVPPPVAMVTCWDDSEADSQAACPTKVTCWNGDFARDAASCPAEPAAEPVTEPTMLSCWDGSQVDDLAKCAPEPAPIPEPAPTPAPVVVAGNCACSGSSVNLFDIPNRRPMTVTYLGSNPQFGDSHGLTPTQFFDKLSARYSASRWDAAYLDHVFRNLGYAGGFLEADASVVSNTTLTNGTTGLLGYGRKHALQYSKLAMSNPRDLEAFRIRAKNGCDINYMKTCGNYMYACNP